MSKNTQNKQSTWRATYSGFIIAICCFISLILSWGTNLILTIILALGVVICSAIGIADVKRSYQKIQ